MNYGLAEILRFIREITYNDDYPRKRLSQETLATKLGRSTCVTSMYETGLAKIPEDVLCKLANIYNLPITCFKPFYGTEHYTKSEKMDALYKIFSQVSKSQPRILNSSMRTLHPEPNIRTNCAHSDIHIILSFIRIMSGYSIRKLSADFSKISKEEKVTPTLIKKVETPGNIPTAEQIHKYSIFFGINATRISFWIMQPHASIRDKQQNLYAIYATIMNNRARDFSNLIKW